MEGGEGSQHTQEGQAAQPGKPEQAAGPRSSQGCALLSSVYAGVLSVPPGDYGASIHGPQGQATSVRGAMRQPYTLALPGMARAQRALTL